MNIYVFIYLLILAFAIFLKLGRTRSFNILLFFFLGGFLCLGYMTGSDWRQYEVRYESLTQEGIPVIEFGWYFYQYVFKFIGIKFWHFFIFTKIICFAISINFLRKYSMLSTQYYLTTSFNVMSKGMSPRECARRELCNRYTTN